MIFTPLLTPLLATRPLLPSGLASLWQALALLIGTLIISGCVAEQTIKSQTPSGGIDYEPHIEQQSEKEGERIVNTSRASLRALKRNSPYVIYDSQPKTRQPKISDDERIRIALLLPLSADSKDVRNIALDLKNAAQLALFDLRRERLMLLIHDTKGTKEGARRATQNAVRDGAKIIIGPLFSTSVSAISPLARSANVPVLSLANNREVSGRGVWLIGFLPEQNLDRIIASATARGLTRFAALIPETPYGARVRDALPDIVHFYGGELVQMELYQNEAQSMFAPVQTIARFEERKIAWEEERARLTEEAQILLSTLPDAPEIDANKTSAADAAGATEEMWEQIGELNPDLKARYDAMRLTETFGELPYDAILLPEGGVLLRSLAPLLPYFDVNPREVKFLGTGLWDDPILGQEPPLIGGWYAAPNPAGWHKFAARFEKIYGQPPERLASLAYDGVSLVAALSATYPDAPFAHKNLTNPNGFDGIDGIFRLTANGLNERGLAVLEVRRKKNRIIFAAPDDFINIDRR